MLYNDPLIVPGGVHWVHVPFIEKLQVMFGTLTIIDQFKVIAEDLEKKREVRCHED